MLRDLWLKAHCFKADEVQLPNSTWQKVLVPVVAAVQELSFQFREDTIGK